MVRNELVLLDNVIAQEQASRDTPLAEDVAFELFACLQALKSYELSPDEAESGRVGGGNDGGLDGIYVFLGETLLAEDAEVLSDDKPPSSFERGLPLTLWLVQAKREESFSETAVDKLESSLRRLLDLSKDDEELLALYSPEVVRRIRIFTSAWQKLSSRKPRLRISVRYASRGDASVINEKVKIKADQLVETIGKLVPGSEAAFDFIGAAELWDSYSVVPSYDLELTFRESLTSGSSHVAIVPLADYLSFLTDTTGNIRRHIFDWNVRDYQGDVEVNREIRGSLADQEAPEFWWLNNGVTIVCSEASIVGKKFNLHDVQVVNGLQTSHTIFEALRERRAPADQAERGILVRILPTRDPVIRDRVIRATNRQTSVPVASLRATDEIQRNIESYFEQQEWYYDRRKNYWRNVGKSSDRIVSIPFLAQAVMAIGLGEPNNSRARPSSLLKRDEDYDRIFSTEVPLQTYLWLARTQRRVDDFLSSGQIEVTGSEKTNLRFYISMIVTSRHFGSRVYSPAQLATLANENTEFADDELEGAFKDVKRWAEEFMNSESWALDRTAKSKEFTSLVLERSFRNSD